MGVFANEQRAWNEHQAMREEAMHEYLWPTGKGDQEQREEDIHINLDELELDFKANPDKPATTIPRVQALRELASDYISFLNPRYDPYRADREVCLAAIKADPVHYVGIDNRFKLDKEFNKEALAINARVFRQFIPAMRGDTELAPMAIAMNGDNLADAIGKFNEDPKLVLTALKRSVQPDLLHHKIGKYLRQEIGNNDPKQYIEAKLLDNTLKNELRQKQEPTQKKVLCKV